MANYAQDFDGFSAASGLPTGFTSRIGASGTYSTVDTGSGDIALRGNISSAGRHYVSMDAVDSDGNRDNAEILVRLRTPAVTTSTALVGCFVRGSGSTGSDNGYAAFIFGNEVRLNKAVSGSVTALATTSGKAIPINTWWWIRLRANSTTITVKAWADGDSEPGSWDLSVTDSSVTGTGWTGAWFFNNGNDYDIGDMAVATNGDNASLAGGPAAYTITASPGTYSVSGQAAALVADVIMPAATGSYTITGVAATLNGPSDTTYSLTAETGSYSTTFQTVSHSLGRVAYYGTYTLTGNAATLTYTQPAAYSLTASAGSYNITGRTVYLLGPGDTIPMNINGMLISLRIGINL